jgi:tRNA threonylcarbamoyladenosine biosynthesis protein TsaE
VLTIISRSPEETDRLGRGIGERLWPGAFLALTGDLGTGKTRLCRAVMEGLGVHRTGGSPTFTLLWEYNGRLPVYHWDVYRLKEPAELEELGYEEYFYGQGVCLVEWAETVRELWPDEYIQIELVYGSPEEPGGHGLDARTITLTARGAAGERLLEELAHADPGA